MGADGQTPRTRQWPQGFSPKTPEWSPDPTGSFQAQGPPFAARPCLMIFFGGSPRKGFEDRREWIRFWQQQKTKTLQQLQTAASRGRELAHLHARFFPARVAAGPCAAERSVRSVKVLLTCPKELGAYYISACVQTSDPLQEKKKHVWLSVFLVSLQTKVKMIPPKNPNTQLVSLLRLSNRGIL